MELFHTVLALDHSRLAATARLTEQARRANSHRNRGTRTPEPAPDLPAPTAFGVTIADVARDGTFPAEGFAERVTAWARATVTAWQCAGGSAV